MKKVALSLCSLFVLCSAAPASAELIELNCNSQIAGAFIQGSGGGYDSPLELAAYEVAKSRVSTCVAPSQHVCPPGTIDAGVTNRVECTEQDRACQGSEWFPSGACSASPQEPSGGGAQGYCCKVACKIVKTCIVPGA